MAILTLCCIHCTVINFIGLFLQLLHSEIGQESFVFVNYFHIQSWFCVATCYFVCRLFYNVLSICLHIIFFNIVIMMFDLAPYSNKEIKYIDLLSLNHFCSVFHGDYLFIFKVFMPQNCLHIWRMCLICKV